MTIITAFLKTSLEFWPFKLGLLTKIDEYFFNTKYVIELHVHVEEYQKKKTFLNQTLQLFICMTSFTSRALSD